MAKGLFRGLALPLSVACLMAIHPLHASADPQITLEDLSKKIETLAEELAKIKAAPPVVRSSAEAPSRTDYEELTKRIQVLAEELEKLKLGEVAEAKYESYSGLGPAASKVYGALSDRLSIGGYGEMIYTNYQDSTIKDYADAYRFILYGGYKFNDHIVMNTELEFEHAGINNVGGSTSGVSPSVSDSKSAEVYVEFSYLDFLIAKPFNLRAGLMLMPIGFLNEYHEPTVYHGVLRPDVETNIIPTTWREMGIMAHGQLGKLSYNAAIVNGLRADRFSSSSWLRNSRQQGAGINASEAAGIVNVSYEVLPELNIGGTYYLGNAAHGKGKDTDPLGAAEKQGTVTLWEAHAEYKYKGLSLRGLYTQGEIDGNTPLKAAPPGSVGKEVRGWYAEAAYDVMPLIKADLPMALTPFIRHEEYDTHRKVFTGSRDKTLERTVTTLGLGFKPHPNVVVKIDYQWRDSESSLPQGKGSGKDSNKIDQVNVGLGFIF